MISKPGADIDWRVDLKQKFYQSPNLSVLNDARLKKNFITYVLGQMEGGK